MTTKKPDSKGILLSDSYIRNMKCSAIPVHFSINTDILLLQPCDPLCLFRGLTFMEKSPQTLMFTDFLATALTASLTPRVGLEPTTTRLTAECSTIELSRIILFFCTFSSVCDRVVALPLSYRGLLSFLLSLSSLNPSSSHCSLGFMPSKPNTEYPLTTLKLLTLHLSSILNSWLSSRPISKCQLSVSPRLHLTPIYLVLSKGAFILAYPDASS